MMILLSVLLAQDPPAEPDGCHGYDARTCPEESDTIDDEIAENAGVLGALSDESELDSIFGPSGLDPDLAGGIGGLIGAEGTQVGTGGLGSRSSGLGGGGTAEGLGGLGTKGKGYGSTGDGGSATAYGDPIILGALDISVMRPVMAGLEPTFQQCQTDHGGTGKVVIKFVVAKDGTISSSTVKTSTTGNSGLDNCVAGTMLRAVFPEPKGGGIVIVSWPILLE